MQMLKKLFNSENKYFLELKESDAVQTAVETTKKVAYIYLLAKIILANKAPQGFLETQNGS